MAQRPATDAQAAAGYGNNGFAPQEERVLTDLLAVQLGQVSCDVQDQLVNNDYENKFFEWGDTVKVVAIDPNSVRVEARNFKSNLRPMLNDLEFSMNTMVIDKQLAYGFKIGDLEKIETHWNLESANIALAARKMRETRNLKTIDTILSNPDIPALGVTSPVNIFTNASTDPQAPAKELFRIVNIIAMQLARAGATDRNGEYEYGSNKTNTLRTAAGLFLGPELKLALLNSQYTRVDDVTEGVIREGKYEKFGGFILNQANELSTTSPICSEVLKAKRDALRTAGTIQATDELAAIIVGTKNLVTRASKVMPVEKMRSEVERATKYDCLEIYGEMVAVPQAGVIVFCVIPGGQTLTFEQNNYGSDANASKSLLRQYRESMPYVNVPAANSDTVTGAPFGSLGRDAVEGGFVANTGYTQYGGPADMSAYATTAQLTSGLAGKASSTHVHDVTSTFTYDADTPADSTVTNEVGAPEEPESNP